MGIKHVAVKATGDRGLHTEWNDDHHIDGDVNFLTHEAQNMAIHNSATAPVGPATGQIYFDTTDKVLKVWNGTSWDILSQDDGLVLSLMTGSD